VKTGLFDRNDRVPMAKARAPIRPGEPVPKAATDRAGSFLKSVLTEELRKFVSESK